MSFPTGHTFAPKHSVNDAVFVSVPNNAARPLDGAMLHAGTVERVKFVTSQLANRKPYYVVRLADGRAVEVNSAFTADEARRADKSGRIRIAR